MILSGLKLGELAVIYRRNFIWVLLITAKFYSINKYESRPNWSVIMCYMLFY